MINWETPNAQLSRGIDGLQVIRSEKFIVVTRAGRYRSKILQIIFWKDGSIFIDFPFFAHTDGLVSLMTWNANIKPPTNLSMLSGGKVTSHLVKFSHHPDGNAHFSQTGKVLTKVRKLCPPIDKVEHLFTAQIQGLASYDQFDPPKEKISNPKERTFIEAVFKGKSPEAIKIFGMLYTRKNLRGRSSGYLVGPVMDSVDPTGKISRTCICSSPVGTVNEDLTLLIMCESIPKVDKLNKAALTFIGGFDERKVTDDITKETTFLAMSYPQDNIDELAKQIGSIDFIRNSAK
jgi:hypothetical protein